MPNQHHHVPPGVARSFERGAVDNDLPELPEGGMPPALREWAGKNLTVQNGFLLILLLFQAGGWWRQQEATTQDLQRSVSAFEVRLKAAEAAAALSVGTANDKLSIDAANSTFMRRDVIEERLRAMTDRLASIEALMRERKDR